MQKTPKNILNNQSDQKGENVLLKKIKGDLKIPKTSKNDNMSKNHDYEKLFTLKVV